MARRPQLAQDIQDQINKEAMQARPYWEKGDYREALKHMLQAWELIPNPKTHWDFYAQSMSRTFVKAYIELKDFENAGKWIDIVREAYDALQLGVDPTVDFIQAEFLFHTGDLEKAFEIFDMIYKKYKKRPFVDEDPKLWTFYQNHR